MKTIILGIDMGKRATEKLKIVSTYLLGDRVVVIL